MDGRWVVDVASVGDVQAAVRGARADGSRLRVVGARGVERFAPGAVAGAGLLSMRGLDRIEIAGPDFTVRVGAGVLVPDLDAALGRPGLVWPVRRLEAPGTVGGLIASGRGTTITAQDGPARRWVLGARLVDGTGEVLTVGGGTVKNSVGYGVTHALWGSEGRLGAIVELTLRVRRRRAWDDAAGEVLEREALAEAKALVRCEDLAPGTAELAVKGMAGATQAAASSDGLRVVGCYRARDDAEADVAGLRALTLEALVEAVEEGERGEGAAPGESPGGAVAWGALDPGGVFV